MEAYEAIMKRTSVRKFKDQPVPDELIEKVLHAAQAGPSCADTRDWQFLVVKDKEMLAKMADANGRFASPLKDCAFGVMVLGDLDRAFPGGKEYWVVDGAIAGQNMMIAAVALGLGGVWLGTWPQMDRVERQRKLFGLPDNVEVHSLFAFGYPADEVKDYVSSKPLEKEQIHYEQW